MTIRVLNSTEIEQVNGAGFVQDSLADIGEKVGTIFGDVGVSVAKGLANAVFPALGTGISMLESFGLLSGSTIGRMIGFGSGAFIEGAASGFLSGFKSKFK
ncbi:hypothetical protein [Budvicia diplopodorum]|uniref:hypothetical protein n=1 Tax=Budvicia diplopodorum TaxID=1119056 RepID=UPI0013583D53|nr:hypothetical protein [Budvicia diplopodorum]